MNQFLPGQWLDVYVPGISSPGGFTITSTPQDVATQDGYLELAIQRAPENPCAAWFWQDVERIREKQVKVRVGGSFVWPPPSIPASDITRVVFVAGGVGVKYDNLLSQFFSSSCCNWIEFADTMMTSPLVSILSHLQQTDSFPPVTHFLYSTRHMSHGLEAIPFCSRISKMLCCTGDLHRRLRLFRTKSDQKVPSLDVLNADQHASGVNDPSRSRIETSPARAISGQDRQPDILNRRMSETDLNGTLGPIIERPRVVLYVCGPPLMTDWAVARFKVAPGIEPERVLCEKWW